MRFRLESEAERATRQEVELENFRASSPFVHKVLRAEGNWAWNPIEALELVCQKLYELEQRIDDLER